MCGPADYVALQTCLVRTAELSAAGLAAGVLYRTGKSILDLVKARRTRPGKTGKKESTGVVVTQPQ